MLTLDEYLLQARQYGVVPVTAEFIADRHTPVTLLERFYHKHEGVFLFESVEGGEKWGRYSFLGIDVSSGGESDPGIKDMVKVRRLIETVRQHLSYKEQ